MEDFERDVMELCEKTVWQLAIFHEVALDDVWNLRQDILSMGEKPDIYKTFAALHFKIPYKQVDPLQAASIKVTSLYIIKRAAISYNTLKMQYQAKRNAYHSYGAHSYRSHGSTIRPEDIDEVIRRMRNFHASFTEKPFSFFTMDSKTKGENK